MLTLSIRNLSVNFSGNDVIRDVSATLHGGEMVAVIGRNGAGKTTFIKALAHLVRRYIIERFCCAEYSPAHRRIAPYSLAEHIVCHVLRTVLVHRYLLAHDSALKLHISF